MKKLGGQTFKELDKARGLNKNYNPKLIDTTKLEDNYVEIKPIKKVEFITIKDTDFGEIRIEKSLVDFLNEPVKNYSQIFDTYTGIIIDFGTKKIK